MDFGKAIAMGMASKKMKRKELAELLGKSMNHTHSLCNGYEQPTLNTLIELSELFDIKLSTFIGWAE